MPWVWIEGKDDTADDKAKYTMVSNVLTSVKGGYKGTAADFNNLVLILDSIFATNKKIDVSITAVGK